MGDKVTEREGTKNDAKISALAIQMNAILTEMVNTGEKIWGRVRDEISFSRFRACEARELLDRLT